MKIVSRNTEMEIETFLRSLTRCTSSISEKVDPRSGNSTSSSSILKTGRRSLIRKTNEKKVATLKSRQGKPSIGSNYETFGVGSSIFFAVTIRFPNGSTNLYTPRIVKNAIEGAPFIKSSTYKTVPVILTYKDFPV